MICEKPIKFREILMYFPKTLIETKVKLTIKITITVIIIESHKLQLSIWIVIKHCLVSETSYF